MSTEKIYWGLGLRPSHYANWHTENTVPVLEIMADNLLYHKGGPALWHTHRIVERSPFVVMHGVALNIGGESPLSKTYLTGLKELLHSFKPTVISDHLCFTQANGLQSYELLPLMRNSKTIQHVAERIDHVQQSLGVRFSIENVSAYVEYNDDQIPEGEFINEIAARTGCGILLDVNNVFVSAINFNKDPLTELLRFNFNAVTQIHVAGHSQREDFLFDTHDTPVCQDVWMLLREALVRFAKETNHLLPVILENDNRETSLKDLLSELRLGQEHCGLTRSQHGYNCVFGGATRE